MVNFPTSLDTGTTLPNPTGTSTQNNPDHASLHGSENAAIIAAETKIGIGSSVPAANTLLFGTGPGTSAWTALTSAQLAATLSDETGSGSAVFGTSPTLITPKVDTINENTLGNGTTIGGVNIKSGALNTASSVPAAAIQSGAVGNTQVAAGVVVQVVHTASTAVATGTTVIPYDDTIPQNTEGDQYMTLAITPKATTNRIFIECVFWGSVSVANEISVALFQDATANALASVSEFNATGTARHTVKLGYEMAAGTTSATTFKVRAGPAVAGTTTFNGDSSARRFGGTGGSWLRITEVKV